MPHLLSIQGPFIPEIMNKKPFVLRIDYDKLKAIEKWAADEFRSTNGQLEYIIDQALRKSGRWNKVRGSQNERTGGETSEL